jgi:hypothetical protein
MSNGSVVTAISITPDATRSPWSISVTDSYGTLIGLSKLDVPSDATAGAIFDIPFGNIDVATSWLVYNGTGQNLHVTTTTTLGAGGQVLAPGGVAGSFNSSVPGDVPATSGLATAVSCSIGADATTEGVIRFFVAGVVA